MTVYLNTNAEMLFFDYEDTSFIDDSAIERVYDAAFAVFIREIGAGWAFYRVGCSSNFKDWNGGKFSHQAKMYGYTVGKFFAIREMYASETLLNICYLAQSAMEEEIVRIWNESCFTV